MIKVSASVTKKRPSAEEYSSDMFHAGIEIELPESVYTNGNGDLRENLGRMLKEVEATVDHQIGARGAQNNGKPSGGPEEARQSLGKAGGASESPEGAPKQLQGLSGGSHPQGNGSGAAPAPAPAAPANPAPAASNGAAPPPAAGAPVGAAPAAGNGNVNHNSGNGGNGGNGDVATNKQVAFLLGLAQREAKMSLPELRAFVKRQTGKTDVYAISRAQASSLIEQLRNPGGK